MSLLLYRSYWNHTDRRWLLWHSTRSYTIQQYEKSEQWNWLLCDALYSVWNFGILTKASQKFPLSCEPSRESWQKGRPQTICVEVLHFPGQPRNAAFASLGTSKNPSIAKERCILARAVWNVTMAQDLAHWSMPVWPKQIYSSWRRHGQRSHMNFVGVRVRIVCYSPFFHYASRRFGTRFGLIFPGPFSTGLYPCNVESTAPHRDESLVVNFCNATMHNVCVDGVCLLLFTILSHTSHLLVCLWQWCIETFCLAI